MASFENEWNWLVAAVKTGDRERMAEYAERCVNSAYGLIPILPPATQPQPDPAKPAGHGTCVVGGTPDSPFFGFNF